MPKISTKTGDQGETGLIDGSRVSKSQPVFEVLGSLDELNSWLGVVVSHLSDSFSTQREQLLQIQRVLFYIGAEIAGSTKTSLKIDHLNDLERIADQVEAELGGIHMTRFVLPGGSREAAYLDVCRAVCRRAERATVRYSQDNKVRPLVIQYLNRLSDYLYLLRFSVNIKCEYTEEEFTP